MGDSITLLFIGLLLYNFFSPFKELVDDLVKPGTHQQSPPISSELFTATSNENDGNDISSIIVIIDSDGITFLDYYDNELTKRTLQQPKKGEMFEAYFTKGRPIFILVDTNTDDFNIQDIISEEYYNQTFYLDLNSDPILYKKQYPTVTYLKSLTSTVFVGDLDNTNSLTTIPI